MVRQDGYNIIIEMKYPPKFYGRAGRTLYDPYKSEEENCRIINQSYRDESDYRYYLNCVKHEITEFAKNVFAKEIGKDITEEAVKCVDEVVKQTLK